MDDTHTDGAGAMKPDTAELTRLLEEADPADAPQVAEELAERLGEDLDAASADSRPDAERNG